MQFVTAFLLLLATTVWGAGHQYDHLRGYGISNRPDAGGHKGHH
ncbi:MAG: hypothetical protein ACREQ7_11630 [Candidatus Binatia bacterium]